MRTLFYLIFFISISTTLFSQSSPKITISTDKINENGVIKYVHTVKRGETLYSLSKAYNVPQQVIIENNSAMKSGLQTGMMIFIPVTPTINADETTNKEVVVNSIAAKNTTKENIVSNSTIAKEVATKKVATKADKKTSNKKYKKHTAKWYENLDDIATKYKVPVEALYALNSLTTKKLSKRQQILIPDKEYVDNFLANGADMGADANISENISGSKKDNIADNLNNESEQNAAIQEKNNEQQLADLNNESNNNYLTERYDIDRELNISMLLPINGDNELSTDYNYIEFYAGVLLATENLKKYGANINLTLTDNKNGSAAEGIAYESLSSTDLIIGPIRSKHVNDVLNITKSTITPTISPLDMSSENLLKEYNNLIQVPSLANSQLDNLVKKLNEDISSNSLQGNVLLCYEQYGKDTSLVRRAKELLESYNIKYKNVSYTILEGRSITSEMKSALADTLTNFVLIPSNNEGFVNDAVRNLNLIYSGYESTATQEKEPLKFSLNLYGMSKWRGFSTIETEVFHKMGLQLSVPYHIDYNSYETKDFIAKYRALYNAEPSPYAYQGYDVAKYFITLVQKYGKEFVLAAELPEAKMLQSNYSFKRESNESGLGNSATRLIRYNSDYTIVVE